MAPTYRSLTPGKGGRSVRNPRIQDDAPGMAPLDSVTEESIGPDGSGSMSNVKSIQIAFKAA